MTSQTQTRPRASMSRFVGLVSIGSEAKRVASRPEWMSRLATALAGLWRSRGAPAFKTAATTKPVRRVQANLTRHLEEKKMGEPRDETGARLHLGRKSFS